MSDIFHIVSIVIASILGYCFFTYEPDNNSSRLNKIRYNSYELRSSIESSNKWIETKGFTDQTTLNEINQYSNDLINLLNEYKDAGGSKCIQYNQVNDLLESIRRLNIALVNTDNLDAITANGIELIDRLGDVISRVDKYFKEGESFVPKLFDHIFSIIKKFNIIQLLIAFCFGGFIGGFIGIKSETKELIRINKSTRNLDAIKSETKELIRLIKAGTNENRGEIIKTKNNLISLLHVIDKSIGTLYTLEELINDQSSSQNINDVVNTLNWLLEL